MQMKHDLKERAIKLRMAGKTYSEICLLLRSNIPKSTLSFWCKNINLSFSNSERIKNVIRNNAKIAREKALAVNKVKRLKYLNNIIESVRPLCDRIENRDVAKIALAMLYLGEGSKTQKGSLMFGNSNPQIIRLFISLLNYCYPTKLQKYRITVQCRADQDIAKLERFWCHLTQIPHKYFYKAQVDPRTVNKPTKKVNYRGVCRIDYYSADILNELMQIIGLIVKTDIFTTGS
jgi:hypothetical protein